MDRWGEGGPVIGIDLGTTFSCVAVWKSTRVEIIPNDQGQRTTPSYVAFTNKERLVGIGAKNQAANNAQSTIFDAKRLIGRRFSDSSVESDMRTWPFKLVAGPDDRPLIVVRDENGEKNVKAEEISAAILMKMKESAEAFLNCQVKRAIVTVPAYFNDSQRRSTMDAGRIAGLDIVRIINEPTAAALAYGLDLKETGDKRLKKVLIFDLGGGTFDVSVLEIKDGVVDVKATSGDTHLGGEDFDYRMATHFAQVFAKMHGHDIKGNPRAMRKLRAACESAKRALSNSAMEEIYVDSLYDGIDFHGKLTRAKFESLNMDLFQRCMEIVDGCLRDSRLSRGDIDDVVLVGGSTRIVKVQKMLEEMFDGKQLCKSLNVDEAVAYGAAILAANLGGATNHCCNDTVLHDVTPLSLGTPDFQGKLAIFIPRNTAFPTRKEQTWTLTESNLTSTTFPIYEGEMRMARDNHQLGDLHLSGITPAPAYKSSIMVVFSIDENGILGVSAKDLSSGNEASITIKNDHGRLTKDEIERMVADAEMYRATELERKRRAEAKSEFDAFVFEMHESIYGLARLTATEKKRMEEAVERAMEWSEVVDDDLSASEDEYNNRKRSLSNLWDSVNRNLHL